MKFQKSVDGWVIFMSNIHPETKEEDIYDRMTEYGEILNIHLNLDAQTGIIKGYCFIEYKTFEQAKKAVESIEEYRGRKIKINFAFIDYC